jgi:acetoin utilization protein AcuB
MMGRFREIGFRKTAGLCLEYTTNKKGIEMLVNNWMSKRLVTIDINDSMQHAVKLMKEKNIGMLPVMENEKLVGLITDGDLKQASASNATSLEIHELLYLISKIKVREIMTKNPITVPPDFTVEETAEILIRNKISGVPVVDHDGELVGVITQTDIFKALISLTGVGKRGIQFAFMLKDSPGSIKQVADIIRKYRGRMVSILSSYENAPEGYRMAYIRMYSIDRSKLKKLEEELREKSILLYVVDHRDNRREIYEEELSKIDSRDLRLERSLL